jgi:hypothetical protein
LAEEAGEICRLENGDYIMINFRNSLENAILVHTVVIVIVTARTFALPNFMSCVINATFDQVLIRLGSSLSHGLAQF